MMNSIKLPWMIGVVAVAIGIAVTWLFVSGRLTFDPKVTPQAIVALGSLLVSLILGLLSRRVLAQIRASLSTKYLGEFPDYLEDITALVGRARKKLLIVCDHPAFGSLSASDLADHYRVAIHHAAARGVEIECVFLNEQGSVAAVRRQFSTPRILPLDFQCGTVPQPIAEKLLSLLKPISDDSITTNPEKMTYKNFATLVWRFNQVLYGQTFRHHRIRVERIPGPMQLHFWIADGREAVFSVPNNTADDSERAFHTGDHTLIRSLQSTAQRYRTFDDIQQNEVTEEETNNTEIVN